MWKKLETAKTMNLERKVEKIKKYVTAFRTELDGVKDSLDASSMIALTSAAEELDTIISGSSTHVSEDNIKKAVKIFKTAEGKVDFPMTRGQRAEERIRSAVCDNGALVDDCDSTRDWP